MEYLTSANSLVPLVIGVLIGGLVYYFICKSQNATPVVNLNANLISNGEAIDMINRYSCSSDDTASGHLDLGVLLSYVDKMSTQCKSIGMELSGLEYYFAKYDNDPVNANRSTIVIFPTYRDGGNHVPFDPFLSTSSNSKIEVIALNDTTNKNQRSTSKSTWYDNSAAQMVALDRSNMSPPRQPTL